MGKPGALHHLGGPDALCPPFPQGGSGGGKDTVMDLTFVVFGSMKHFHDDPGLEPRVDHHKGCADLQMSSRASS